MAGNSKPTYKVCDSKSEKSALLRYSAFAWIVGFTNLAYEPWIKLEGNCFGLDKKWIHDMKIFGILFNSIEKKIIKIEKPFDTVISPV